ncbi:DUF308 domain-containing protein [Candidatus Uhrbacteria bacterium]|nr:DUF308 domain-containing protein [Candidatus Uhrbacteria bacterium]
MRRPHRIALATGTWLLAIPSFVWAQSVSKIDFNNPNLKLTDLVDESGNGVANLIEGLVTFLVPVAGVTALVMIIIAGITRVVAAGNADRVKTSGDMMWEAIIGLGIALSSVLILNTINPDLTLLGPIKFPEVKNSIEAKKPEVGIKPVSRIGGGGSGGGARNIRGGRAGEWGEAISTNAADGKPYRVTHYWPVDGDGPATTEGRIGNSATPPAAGKEGVCTLEMLYRGECNYVSGAVGRDSPLFGKWAKVNVRKWVNNQNQAHEARDFYVYFHDTGGDFQGNPNNIDIPSDTSNGDPQARTFDGRQPDNSGMTITVLDGSPPIRPIDPY